MATVISFADWVDWLAFECLFLEHYRSGTPSAKRRMAETAVRFAREMPASDRAVFTSQLPNFDRALSSFSVTGTDQLRYRVV